MWRGTWSCFASVDRQMGGRAALAERVGRPGPAARRFLCPELRGLGDLASCGDVDQLADSLQHCQHTRLDAGVQVRKMRAMSAATTNDVTFGRQVKRKFLPRVS